MRRQLMGIFAAAVIVTGGAVQAKAAENPGSIRVVMDGGERTVSSVAVALYHVGEPAEDGYSITESCGGGFVKGYDAQSPELAYWLAEQIVETGWEKELNVDGTVVFEGLQEGLYLLVQTRSEDGFLPAEPFLIPVPCTGEWEVTAYPKTQKLHTEAPKTGQHPAPVLGAMGMVLAGMGLAACVEKIRKNR